MAKKAPITTNTTNTTKSKINILYVSDTAKDKPRQAKIITLGPLLLSTAHIN